MRLSELGWTAAEISLELGVPRHTVAGWRSRGLPGSAQAALAGVLLCDTCGLPETSHLAVPPDAYAFLLGFYLGDGCLSRHARTYQLRLYTDSRYPAVIASCTDAIDTILAAGKAGVYRPRNENYVVISSYSRRWRCLIPQHAPGKKHHRRIVLDPWQQTLVEQHTGPFLRGLVHSDGWRGENRVHVKGHDYSYPRYQFSSRSDDIRRLFTDGCDRLGIAWRPWGRWHISVARREAVARLDEYVGPKT
jgi:hypothetical protein